MDAIALIYIAFILIGIAASSRLSPGHGIALVYLAGILFLPVASAGRDLPGQTPAGDSPYWIMPSALPADIFFTKAVVAALAALVVALLFDRARIFQFRPRWADLPIFSWCLWPLVQSLWTEASPSGWKSSLYLVSTWAIPWILARTCFATHADQRIFINYFVGLTLLLLPIILLESLSDLRVHELIYGPHPFAEVGSERYFGNRPLAFFEDGNQYGMWIAMAALMAVWRANLRRLSQGRRFDWALAILMLGLAIASQSAGAVILLLAGLGLLLFAPALRFLRKAAVPGFLLLTALMAVYLSGALPLRTIAKETAVGQTVWGALQASGRGSLSWRIGQDQKTLPAMKDHIVAGSGQWDWWRELGKRPWGLALLLVGQFGLIGFGLLAAATLRALWTWLSTLSPRTIDTVAPGKDSVTILAITLIMALTDAMLNAFLIMPVVMAAGAIAVAPRDQDTGSTGERSG